MYKNYYKLKKERKLKKEGEKRKKKKRKYIFQNTIYKCKESVK